MLCRIEDKEHPTKKIQNSISLRRPHLLCSVLLHNPLQQPPISLISIIVKKGNPHFLKKGRPMKELLFLSTHVQEKTMTRPGWIGRRRNGEKLHQHIPSPHFFLHFFLTNIFFVSHFILAFSSSFPFPSFNSIRYFSPYLITTCILTHMDSSSGNIFFRI